MKKFLKYFLLLLVPVMFLTGCSTQTETKSESTKTSEVAAKKVEITIKDDLNKKQLAKKEVTFKKGDTLMKVLKANFKITESKGLITAIESVEQDSKKQAYWTFTVNGKMGEKGAADTKLKANDKVVFSLATYKG